MGELGYKKGGELTVIYLRSRKVLIGITYFALMLLLSFSYTYFWKDLIPEPRLTHFVNGKFVAKAPFTPIEVPPFGTDRYGTSNLFKIIEGAKYTIILVLIIVTLRMILGSIIGYLLSLCGKKLVSFISKIFEAVYYVPVVFIVFLLMVPLTNRYNVIEANSLDQLTLIILQVAILVVVGLPALVMYFTNELDDFNNEDYVVASKIMGGHSFWIFRKHFLKVFRKPLIITFLQQCIQVLILFTHLAVFRLFIGGNKEINLVLGRCF
ncbi:MAG: binding--dependent transport system inner rane component family protein [Bacillales bacterium]|nr:binding--dependent transport system inner rane component family protein [Bacillales bacterium]